MKLKTILAATLATALSFGPTDSAKSQNYTCSDYVNAPPSSEYNSIIDKALESQRNGNNYFNEAQRLQRPPVPMKTDINHKSEREQAIALSVLVEQLVPHLKHYEKERKLHINAIEQFRDGLYLQSKASEVLIRTKDKEAMNYHIRGYFNGYMDAASDDNKLAIEQFKKKCGGYEAAIKEIERSVHKQCMENPNLKLSTSIALVVSDVVYYNLPGNFSKETMKHFQLPNKKSGDKDSKDESGNAK